MNGGRPDEMSSPNNMMMSPNGMASGPNDVMPRSSQGAVRRRGKKCGSRNEYGSEMFCHHASLN